MPAPLRPTVGPDSRSLPPFLDAGAPLPQKWIPRIALSYLPGAGPTLQRHPSSASFFAILAPPLRHEEVRNVIVYHRRLRFYVEHSVRFEFLKDLFEYYSQHPVRINNADIMLKRGVRLAKWEIQHKNVTIGRVLGQGAFGEVRKGTLLRRSGRSVPVAVKTLKSDTELSKAKIKEMMKEARLMRDLKHPNVVCIYGVALLEHPLYIILEFVPGGALDAYLRKNKNTIDRDERLLMAMGAAWGMEYLHKSKVLHRDVAARNCLYDNDKIVKISDFGLSRRGTTYKMQTAKKMPIKWMAPESMSNFTFSQKTDVYSYGVLVFEIFSGLEPYEGVSNSLTKKMIIEGQLNQFPEGTPSKLVEFVKEKMWDKDPDNRLDMSHIVDWLEKYTGLALDMPDDSVAQDGDQTGPHKSQAVGRHSQPRTRKRPDKQDHSKKN
ncbi:hypothetical protein Y032_0014g2210 [Ancylostoma ceylanicum]|uniref:non-specific protein-tyrosine kinase n=1 Tax=Ancylostoma ceylanicum TaxID=53326 RepID=A0A016V8Z2_9BILA|nr:hypothetical protein Y032_0014g2210 [Ancylostoma ceylanicum]